jgi:hypothetical protein
VDAPSRTAGVESGTLPDYRMIRVLFLVGLLVLIKYIDRSNLSIAAAVIKDELNSPGHNWVRCWRDSSIPTLLLQNPDGSLVERFDVKWVFDFFIWSAFTVGMFSCNIRAMTQTMAGPQMVGQWTEVENFAGISRARVHRGSRHFFSTRTGHFYWASLITTAVVRLGALSLDRHSKPDQACGMGPHPEPRNKLISCKRKSRSSSA